MASHRRRFANASFLRPQLNHRQPQRPQLATEHRRTDPRRRARPAAAGRSVIQGDRSLTEARRTVAETATSSCATAKIQAPRPRPMEARERALAALRASPDVSLTDIAKAA